MTTARNGQFEVLDYTPLADLVERTDNALDKLGLFESYFGDTTSVQVERVTTGSDVIDAKTRGGDRNYAGDENAVIANFRVPFFPLDKVATAKDVQDFREYGTANTPASVERRVERNIKRIRKSHDFLRRKAMYTALKGNTYAGTLTGTQYNKNFATEFGVAADVITTSIDFTVATSDPALKLEKVGREHIVKLAQDNASEYEVFVLCGSGFFNSIVHHSLVQNAYDQFASDQNPLRERLGGNSASRIFQHKGITYVEDISGELTRDEAYMFPIGIMDMFQLHYAPSDTISDANTEAQELYLWLVQERRRSVIESETSLVAVNTRPELVIAITGNTLLPDA